MSAMISDRARAQARTPTARVANRSREEQFQGALESYIANYRKHRAVTDDDAGGRESASIFWFLPRLASWGQR